mmetsp:Transcript_8056/g.14280  ORF Transcript_8056/g.14280 Transcript_8056/m.14280 type:complete len:632 (-) Transcript_8056:154-2049(-)
MSGRRSQLPLTPDHEYETRHRSTLKSFASTLTAVDAASHWRRHGRQSASPEAVTEQEPQENSGETRQETSADTGSSKKAKLPLTPGHSHHTRRRSTLKSLASSLTAVNAATHWLNRLSRNQSEDEDLLSTTAQEAASKADDETHQDSSEELLSDNGELSTELQDQERSEEERIHENEKHMFARATGPGSAGARYKQARTPEGTRRGRRARSKSRTRTTSDAVKRHIPRPLKGSRYSFFKNLLNTLLLAALATGLYSLLRSAMWPTTTCSTQTPSEINDTFKTQGLLETAIREEASKIEEQYREKIEALELLLSEQHNATAKWQALYEEEVQTQPWSQAKLSQIEALSARIKEQHARFEAEHNVGLTTEEKDARVLENEASKIQDTLKGFQGRVESAEDRVHTLKGMIGTTRAILSPLVEEEAFARNKNKDTTCIPRERIEAVVEELVRAHDADIVGRPDFALMALGAKVERFAELTSIPEAPFSFWEKPFSWFFHRSMRPAEEALNDDMTIGHCWMCVLPQCNITIRLPDLVNVDALSIDHISSKLAVDINSAPKKFRAYGMTQLPAEKDDESGYTPLGEFEFDALTGRQVQTFSLNKPELLQWLKLEIQSNHGHPDWTCLYRARVHGSLV